MRFVAAGLVATLFASPVAAAQAPIVVELFTSQGCSSCPPADAVLTDLSRTRPDVLALGFHVTYWDGLGWRDPFALDAATGRQRAYARQFGTGQVYTPQMVIDGQADVVGSDRRGVLAAIAGAAPPSTPIEIRREGNELAVSIGAGPDAGTVWLIGYDREHRTQVARGENGGRALTESNIVRSLSPQGAFTGAPLTTRWPAPLGEKAVVLVQSPDGRFIGVGQETP